MVNKLFMLLIVGTALWVPSTSFAQGKYKFCGRWSYQFVDEGVGEDHLLHNEGNFGRIDAAYTWAVIWRDGSSVWSGYMDADGCTGEITALAGDYKFWVTTAINKDGTKFWIWPTDDENWQWFSKDYPDQPERPGLVVTHTAFFGFGEQTAAAAAVATHLVQQPNQGLLERKYNIYAKQDCLGQAGFAGCYDTVDHVYLGDDNFGNWVAFNKSIVAHEIGHYVQDKLFGRIDNNYDLDGGDEFPMCSCDHVESSNQAHCIQSREHQSAAQVEGFAQFYAADLYNEGSGSTAGFGYYKEVNVFGFILDPPVAIDVAIPFKWMENYCMPDFLTGAKGTELDWATFYWELNNKTSSAFSYTDLEDVYEQACGGGHCSGEFMTWFPLALAVTDLYGPSTPKALHFSDTSETHGVVHF
ncbi:MAG: hypothetical protein OXU20_29160 [Myxococcales bacterium]|nr:hypothetical protein [Myxococcales bacterium]MDD9969515.1 hypothetical protein [Myxococcales bacterium]